MLDSDIAGQNVTVTVTPASDASTTEVVIKKDGVEISKSSALSQELSENGTYVITAVSQDLAGNKSAQASFTIIINKVKPGAPVITGRANETTVSTGSEIAQNVAITITPSESAVSTEVIVKKDDVEISKSSELSMTLTELGKYVITATSENALGNKSDLATYEVTITKAAPVITAPTVKDLTYNGKSQTLVNAGSATEGTMQYALSTSTTNDGIYGTNLPSATNAGIYYVFYKVEGIEEAYVIAEIKKATPVVTAPTAKTLTNNGNSQELINAGSTIGGTLQYALSTSTTNNGTYGTSIPSAANAGDYYVFYKVVGDVNYNDVAETYVTVTITALDVTAKTGLVYNGKSQTIATSKGSNLKFVVNTTGNVPKSGDFPSIGDGSTNLSQKNAGTYYVFYKTKSGDILGPVVCTIEKANGSGSVTLSDWVEGKTASTPDPTSSTNGTKNVTYKYKLASEPDSSYTSAIPSAAGSYTVQATFAATDNYKEATATANFKIISKEDDPASYIKIEGIKVVCTGGNMGEVSRLEKGDVYYSPATGNYYYALKDTNTGIGTLLVEVLKVGGYVLDIDADGFVAEDEAQEGDLVKNDDGTIKLCIKTERENVGSFMHPEYQTKRTFAPLEIEE